MSLIFGKRRKLMRFGRAGLVALIAWCMFWMGSWIWLDNRLAVVPDLTASRPAASGSLGANQPQRGRDGAPALIAPAGPAGGSVFLVAGNGDADDSYEPPLELRREGRLTSPPRAAKAKGLWGDRRLAVAYKDFGHLKVAPAGEVALNLVVASFLADKFRLSQSIWGSLNFSKVTLLSIQVGGHDINDNACLSFLAQARYIRPNWRLDLPVRL